MFLGRSPPLLRNILWLFSGHLTWNPFLSCPGKNFCEHEHDPPAPLLALPGSSWLLLASPGSSWLLREHNLMRFLGICSPGQSSRQGGLTRPDQDHLGGLDPLKESQEEPGLASFEGNPGTQEPPGTPRIACRHLLHCLLSSFESLLKTTKTTYLEACLKGSWGPSGFSLAPPGSLWLPLAPTGSTGLPWLPLAQWLPLAPPG